MCAQGDGAEEGDMESRRPRYRRFYRGGRSERRTGSADSDKKVSSKVSSSSKQMSSSLPLVYCNDPVFAPLSNIFLCFFSKNPRAEMRKATKVVLKSKMIEEERSWDLLIFSIHIIFSEQVSFFPSFCI